VTGRHIGSTGSRPRQTCLSRPRQTCLSRSRDGKNISTGRPTFSCHAREEGAFIAFILDWPSFGKPTYTNKAEEKATHTLYFSIGRNSCVFATVVSAAETGAQLNGWSFSCLLVTQPSPDTLGTLLRLSSICQALGSLLIQTKQKKKPHTLYFSIGRNSCVFTTVSFGR
jgi:hypothetical protein